MTDRSRYIPKNVDGKVKITSGFRCAWCGGYLTERHHIYPYSLGGLHSEDNLILLCPNCHTEANLGKILINDLIDRKISLTGKVDRSSGCLSINREYFQINVGGCHFTNCKNILMFNDIPLLSAKNSNGYLLFSMRLFNKEGNLICWMNENRWWVENENILDFNHTKNTFSVADVNGPRILDIEIKDDSIDLTGSVYLLGSAVQLLKDRIVFKHKETSFVNCGFRGDNAIVIQEETFNKQIKACLCIPI